MRDSLYDNKGVQDSLYTLEIVMSPTDLNILFYSYQTCSLAFLIFSKVDFMCFEALHILSTSA